MESLISNVAIWWLAAGAVLILLEVMLVAGIGF
jgi:hypothetical protein